MKTVLAIYVALAIILAASFAWAGVTCQQIGNIIYCTNWDTGQLVTCQILGQFTYCN